MNSLDMVNVTCVLLKAAVFRIHWHLVVRLQIATD